MADLQKVGDLIPFAWEINRRTLIHQSKHSPSNIVTAVDDDSNLSAIMDFPRVGLGMLCEKFLTSCKKLACSRHAHACLTKPDHGGTIAVEISPQEVANEIIGHCLGPCVREAFPWVNTVPLQVKAQLFGRNRVHRSMPELSSSTAKVLPSNGVRGLKAQLKSLKLVKVNGTQDNGEDEILSLLNVDASISGDESQPVSLLLGVNLLEVRLIAGVFLWATPLYPVSTQVVNDGRSINAIEGGKSIGILSRLVSGADFWHKSFEDTSPIHAGLPYHFGTQVRQIARTN